MKNNRLKVGVFFTTLAGTLAGVIPVAGCPGGCEACYRCAGAGGIIAFLIAIGAAKNKIWSGFPPS